MFTSDNIASEQAKGVKDCFLHPTDSPNSHPRRIGPVQAPFIQCSMQGSLYAGVYCPQWKVLSLINPALCSTESQHYSCQQMLLREIHRLDVAQIPQEGCKQVCLPGSASTVSRVGQQHPIVAAHREDCRTLQERKNLHMQWYCLGRTSSNVHSSAEVQTATFGKYILLINVNSVASKLPPLCIFFF